MLGTVTLRLRQAFALTTFAVVTLLVLLDYDAVALVVLWAAAAVFVGTNSCRIRHRVRRFAKSS